jgi:hypothetical protein
MKCYIMMDGKNYFSFAPRMKEEENPYTCEQRERERERCS